VKYSLNCTEGVNLLKLLNGVVTFDNVENHLLKSFARQSESTNIHNKDGFKTVQTVWSSIFGPTNLGAATFLKIFLPLGIFRASTATATVVLIVSYFHLRSQNAQNVASASYSAIVRHLVV